jgi:hypothetical protein
MVLVSLKDLAHDFRVVIVRLLKKEEVVQARTCTARSAARAPKYRSAHHAIAQPSSTTLGSRGLRPTMSMVSPVPSCYTGTPCPRARRSPEKYRSVADPDAAGPPQRPTRASIGEGVRMVNGPVIEYVYPERSCHYVSGSFCLNSLARFSTAVSSASS